MTGTDHRAASWSLRRSLTRMLVLAALLPALVFGTALVWNQWQRDRDDLLLRLATSAQSSAGIFDDFLDGQLAGVRLLAAMSAAEPLPSASTANEPASPAVEPASPVAEVSPSAASQAAVPASPVAEVSPSAASPAAEPASPTWPPPSSALPGGGEELDRLLKAYPSLLRAIVTDADGAIVAARRADGRPAMRGAGTIADRDWFRGARDSGLPHVSDGYRASIYGGEAMVAVSAPVFRDGEFQGVVQASLPVERLFGQRSDNLRRRGIELLVIDRSDRVVHASAGLRFRLLDAAGAAGADIRRGAAAPGQAGETRIMDGLLRGGGRAYVDAVRMRTGWVVVLVAPERRLLAPSLPRLGLMLGLLAVTTMGVLLALWRMRRLLATNMGRLLSSLHGYALGGILDPRQLSRMPEELQPLAGGIGDLAARMNAAFAELRDVIDQREHVIAERTESLRDAVDELDRLSRTDALTGCLNYRGFQEQALRLWQAAADKGGAFAVLAIDIDHFKAYNDHYGHLHGDGALKRFAGAVRSALLHADDVLARQGGEEFAVLLPGATVEQARVAASRIRERLREADIVHVGSPDGRMTASIGIAAMAPGEPVPLGMLLTRADAALYRAKTSGRDRAEE